MKVSETTNNGRVYSISEGVSGSGHSVWIVSLLGEYDEVAGWRRQLSAETFETREEAENWVRWS